MKRATGLLLSLICLAFTFPAVADLHDTANSADYLIISSSEIIQQNEWITELADWRDDHGRVSMIVSTEEIFTEFGDGTPLDTTLKEFLHYAYNNWQEPQLKDVFIIGHHDVVPSHVGSLNDIPFISDYYYSWDESEPVLSLLFGVGRLPWSPVWGVPLFDYAAKVIAYESADHGDWQNRVLLIADRPTDHLNWVGIYADPLGDLFPEEFDVEKNYADYPLGHPSHGSHQTVIENLNIGCFLTAYFGLGGPTGSDSAVISYWSNTLRIDSSAVADLNNDERLPVVIGMMADITPEPGGVSPLLWAFLSNPHGGSIANIAFSGVAFVMATYRYRETFFQELISSPENSLGNVWKQTAASHESIFREQNLLIGDPGLRLPDHHLASDIPEPELPHSIELLGNYPNPFNSTTTIRYRLPNSARLTLSIYNVEGQEVAKLVDGPVSAGEHSIQWSAVEQASGIYFVTLKAGGSMQTHKMVFLK
ncbi:T9SS type A sorting domain-containing protein [bacterium]|nr:T9SS type A sorting domain-containing protein [bacterium]